MWVPLIEIGPLSKKDFPLVRLTANDSQRPNLRGMDLLKDSCCHFFFDEMRMVIQDEPEGDWPFQDLSVGKKFHPYLAIQFETLIAQTVWEGHWCWNNRCWHELNTKESCLFSARRTSSRNRLGRHHHENTCVYDGIYRPSLALMNFPTIQWLAWTCHKSIPQQHCLWMSYYR
jgi:hypothetical protein